MSFAPRSCQAPAPTRRPTLFHIQNWELRELPKPFLFWKTRDQMLLIRKRFPRILSCGKRVAFFQDDRQGRRPLPKPGRLASRHIGASRPDFMTTATCVGKTTAEELPGGFDTPPAILVPRLAGWRSQRPFPPRDGRLEPGHCR